VRYSQGYLAQREARLHPDDAPALLASAADRYRAVLAEEPTHEATLRNLALVYLGLGRDEAAETVLKQAVAADAGRTGRAALQLGQLYRDEGKFDAALAAYGQAGAAAPADAAPPQAIVALYATAPERAAELRAKLASWETTFPAVADNGYRQILARATEPEVRERAVLDWVSLVARKGWVGPSTFAGLPLDWPPLADAARFVANPETPPYGWWAGNPVRRSVLAQLALATAQAPEARATPARALRRLQVGLQLCPGYEEYQYNPQMKDAWPTRLELARATLSLLSREPALDPKQEQQRWLVNELFFGKAGAYQSQDLAAMQRFHTTLGRWYAERGEWTGGSSTNGIFQLEHAIAVAGQRAARGEPWQPLQQEKALLAGGYEKIGKPAQAWAMYLDAASAFLDTDQVDEALDALRNADRVGGATGYPPDPSSPRLLQQVAATRQALAADSVPPDFAALPAQRWLALPPATDAARRQRFKVLADLALRERDGGQPEAAATHAGAAFEALLSLKSLVGTADLVRVEQVLALATAGANLGDRGAVQVASLRATADGDIARGLYVPAAGQPVYVIVRGDAVIAGQVGAKVRASAALAGQVRRINVEAGHLDVFMPDGSGNASKEAARSLREVPGVRSLSLIPG
jgi:tetratricopeptide (TPR) repeat protein